MEHVLPSAERAPQYKYFDPKKSEIPDQVFGLPSDQLLDAAPTIGAIVLQVPYSVRGYEVGQIARTIRSNPEDVLRVAPLVERALDGEQLEREDVRPYRKSIKALAKRHVAGLGVADRALTMSGIGLLLRPKLNRKIEDAFIEQVPLAIEKAREGFAAVDDKVEPHVEWASSFENPKAQVQTELDLIAQSIRESAHFEATLRHSGRPNAEDAAVGIRDTIDRIYEDQRTPSGALPVVNKLMSEANVPKPEIQQKYLAIGAPDIITGLERSVAETDQNPRFLQRVTSQPHHQAWMANWDTSGRVDQFRYVVRRLIPDAVNLLPERGSDIRSFYEKAKQVLGIES